VGELIVGMRTAARGWSWWRRRPAELALGLVPAALVAAVAFAALAVLAANIGGIADALTPFADGWSPFWLTTARVLAGTAVFGAAIVLTVVTFTAATLAFGEPWYDRIWRAVEGDLGADGDFGVGGDLGAGPAAVGAGYWRGLGDAAALVGRGALAALAAGLVGLLPVVGGVAGAVVGVVLTGWLLAGELASRPLAARGLDRRARGALLRAHRPRVLGFGVATQLCFLVPFGAVVTMPAAVAGATLLARSLLAPAAPVPAGPDPAAPGPAAPGPAAPGPAAPAPAAPAPAAPRRPLSG